MQSDNEAQTTTDDTSKRLDDLLEAGSTLMVGTPAPGGRLEFRPLTVAQIDGPTIRILLDSAEQWVAGVKGGDPVWVTMSDNRTNTWVSLDGRLSLSTDRALIDELWNPFAAAYFEQGRDTPSIAVLTIDSREGRYWSTTSGRLGSLISMVRAAVGHPESSGEHGDLDLTWQRSR
jgi:general stress protein 26